MHTSLAKRTLSAHWVIHCIEADIRLRHADPLPSSPPSNRRARSAIRRGRGSRGIKGPVYGVDVAVSMTTAAAAAGSHVGKATGLLEMGRCVALCRGESATLRVSVSAGWSIVYWICGLNARTARQRTTYSPLNGAPVSRHIEQQIL